VPDAKADYTLRIATGLVELSPTHIISTALYNDQFPGPPLRFKEGQQVIVDVHNDTDTPELVHWHGQLVPSDVDGSSEEGTPFVPAHGMRRIVFVPRPAGFLFYHTHVFAGADLNRSTYTGQAGPVYIEPASNPGAYDREVFLILKEFAPSWSRGGDMAMDILAGTPNPALQQMGRAVDDKTKGTPKGFEVGYELFSINGRMRGHGEPIHVKYGERVLFHVLNASATEIRSLALPGHVFRVVALDGNPVPRPAIDYQMRPANASSIALWPASNVATASDAAPAKASVAKVRMAQLRMNRYRAGSNNSIGFPSGSSIWICLPPGPVSMSFRKWRPAFFSVSMNAGRSVTRSTTRFHPPGSCGWPFGIGRDPDACGPLRSICASPNDTLANAGSCWCSSVKPRCVV
jgi:multicopper oxidase